MARDECALRGPGRAAVAGHVRSRLGRSHRRVMSRGTPRCHRTRPGVAAGLLYSTPTLGSRQLVDMLAAAAKRAVDVRILTALRREVQTDDVHNVFAPAIEISRKIVRRRIHLPLVASSLGQWRRRTLRRPRRRREQLASMSVPGDSCWRQNVAPPAAPRANCGNIAAGSRSPIEDSAPTWCEDGR